MTKPVLCFDFDGTLVDGEGHIHPRDVALLRENSQAHFLPATGRPLHAVRRAFVRNGLSWPASPCASDSVPASGPHWRRSSRRATRLWTASWR